MRFLLGLAVFAFILISVHGFTAYTWMVFLNPGISGFWYWTVWLTLSLSFILASLIDYWLPGSVARILYTLSALWLGIFFHLILGAVILWVIRLVGLIGKFNVAATYVPHGVLAVAGLMILWGLWNAQNLTVTDVSIPMKDLPDVWKERKIVLISDVHIGRIRQKRFLNKLVKKINDLSPDLVAITGDLIDHGIKDISEYVSSFGQFESKFGVFYVTGNHEIMGNANNIRVSLRQANFTILENEVKTVDGLSFWGVGYPPMDREQLPLSVPKLKHPTILLHHSPVSMAPLFDPDKIGNYDAYSNREGDFSFEESLGVALMLTGHTHAGQMFPLNYITHYLFQGYDYGLNAFEDLLIYTSSGITPWGPPFRTICHSEIVLISLVDKEK